MIKGLLDLVIHRENPKSTPPILDASFKTKNRETITVYRREDIKHSREMAFIRIEQSSQSDLEATASLTTEELVGLRNIINGILEGMIYNGLDFHGKPI